jgi:hypothetical protein
MLIANIFALTELNFIEIGIIMLRICVPDMLPYTIFGGQCASCMPNMNALNIEAAKTYMALS